MRKEFKITEKPISLSPFENSTGISAGIVALMKSRAKNSSTFEKENERSDKWRKELLLELLEVVDSLERILAQAEESPAKENTEKITGHVRTTLQQMNYLLKRRGIMPFDTKGREADPAFTEIVDFEERKDIAEDVVIKETSKGYVFKGQLLRRARVIVARKKEA